MITIQQLEDKIADITGVDTRSKNKREYFRTVIRFLQENPNRDYLIFSLGVTEGTLWKRRQNMPVMYDLKGMETQKKKWEEENEIPKLRLQIKTLRLILGNDAPKVGRTLHEASGPAARRLEIDD